jgi:hypothetical protein
VGAEAAGELAYALHRLVAAFTHYVGGPELLRERDPVWMAAEENDPLRVEPSCGDYVLLVIDKRSLVAPIKTLSVTTAFGSVRS